MNKVRRKQIEDLIGKLQDISEEIQSIESVKPSVVQESRTTEKIFACREKGKHS